MNWCSGVTPIAVCACRTRSAMSRGAIAVWVEAGELHFQVLSEINGVDMWFGEAPPGARGVLPAGQTLRLAQYSVSAAPGAAQPTPDPWAVFDREGSGVAPVHCGGAGLADSGASRLRR